MTINLSDPRLAAEIASLVDRRLEYALRQLAPQTRYGTVSAVDVPNRVATVLLGGSTTGSPGFVFPLYLTPAIGDVVRVVTRGADRYIDDNLSKVDPAAVPFSGREIVLTANHGCANNTWVKPTGYGSGRFWHPGGEFGISSSAIVLPYDGLYLVTAVAEWVANASGVRAIGIGTGTVSPSATYHQQRAKADAVPSVVVRGAYLHPAVAGETLALWAWQNCGGSLAVVGGLTALAVVYLGPNPAAILARPAPPDGVDSESKPAPKRRRAKT